jgi:predicted amidohydrolase YtcJ
MDRVLIRKGKLNAITSTTTPPDGADTHLDGYVVPGLVDAHLHPIGYTASLHRPSLKRAADFEEIAGILAAAAANQPSGTAVTGLRLDDESLAEGRLPNRHLLDRAVPDRPALVVRYCGHVSIANTRALEIAGIGPGTPDPPGGTIDRDETGSPTGVLRETAADTVSRSIRSLAPPVERSQIVTATRALASLGLTSVGAIVDVRQGCWAGRGSELGALVEAAEEIPIRVRALVIANTPAELTAAAGRLADAGPRVSFLGLKIFSDGSLGGHTAAMHDPYADRPDRRGTDRLDPRWAAQMIRAAVGLGGRTAVHAIGDAANAAVLDLMEGLIEEGIDPELLRVEHASVLTEGDVERFGRLGITAVVQPAFLASEHGWLESRLGPDRLRRTYAFRSLLEAGAPLAGSSDSPVEPPHPLWGMAAARDRCGIVPEEGLTAEQALSLFTDGARRAVGETADSGDVVLLDRDPVSSSPDDLRRARVLATFVEGERVAVPPGVLTWQA